MYRHLLKLAVPLPDITKYQRYLFVGAHPDDIEIGCGGLVSKLSKSGKEISFAIVTDGASGSLDSETDQEQLVDSRKKESLAAKDILGVKKIYFMDFPDGGDYRMWDVAKRLAELCIQIDPEIIFAPDPLLPSEIHPDHIKAGKAVETSVLMSLYPLIYVRNIGEFIPEKKHNFHSRTIALYFTHRPNKYVTLEKEDIDKQKTAIEKHRSQFSNPEELVGIYRYMTIRGRIFGSHGKRGKEGYFVRSGLQQHCFPEVNFY